MCLIIVSYKVHPDYPLVVAANRDEMYKRPTREAQFWSDKPSILAGQDLEKGGTWLGLDTSGRFAAVTNYRDGSKSETGITSRGLLVSLYLQNHDSPERYLEQTITKISDFGGFNLLLGDVSALYFLNSRDRRYRQLQAGIFGISNGCFDEPWPKVESGKQGLSMLMATDKVDDHEAILDLLADSRQPDDQSLPDTGIGLQWERILAPVFIRAEEYGTRASTVLSIDKENKVRFSERSYDSAGNKGNTRHFEFTIKGQR